MRKNTWLFLSCLIAGSITFFCLQGCLKDKVKETFGHDSVAVTYTIYTPVYQLKSVVLASLNGSAAQPVVQPGQLYIKGSYIYLNDMNAGIHVIDNSDPANPVQKAFLKIPGNQNIAIRGNILYADMYSDLLAIDISNPSQARIEGTLWDAFPYRNMTGDSTKVIISWNIHDTTFREKAYGDPLASPGYYGIPGTQYYTLDASAIYAASSYVSSTSNTNASGTPGSTASMALVGDYLYSIPDRHVLEVISVSDATHPSQVRSISAGLDLETVFPMQDKLLLGSMEGVYVYSLTNPAQPGLIGQFTHGEACDPVIADSKYAYVTLKSGTYCGGTANELDVISGEDLTSSSLLRSYPMTGPSGLSKDGSMLFVCDSNVVRVFNATDALNLQELTDLKVNSAHDVIAANHDLIVVAAGGLYQFDYSDPTHINQLSYLAIK